MEKDTFSKDHVIQFLKVILEICIVIIGYFLTTLISDIKTNTGETNKKIEQVQLEFNTASTKLSNQIDSLAFKYQNHEFRIETLEKNSTH